MKKIIDNKQRHSKWGKKFMETDIERWLKNRKISDEIGKVQKRVDDES